MAVAEHMGGALALYPVVKQLREEGFNTNFYVSNLIFDQINSRIKDVFFMNINDVEKITSINNPDLILAGTSVSDENRPQVLDQEIISYSKKNNINSVGILDLWKSYRERFEDSLGNLSYLPDKLCVMDNLAVEDMSKVDIPIDQLTVTGNPANDMLISQKKKRIEDLSQFREHLKLDSDSRIIFYVGQPLSDKNGKHQNQIKKAIFRDITSSVSSLPGKNYLVFRPHPRENLEDILEIRNDLCSKSIIIDGVDTNRTFDYAQSLNGSNLVLSVHSTSLVESTYLGIPAISFQGYLPEVERNYLPPIRAGLVPLVIDKKDFDFNLKQILENYELIVSNIKNSGFFPKGDATQKVVNLIKSYL